MGIMKTFKILNQDFVHQLLEKQLHPLKLCKFVPMTNVDSEEKSSTPKIRKDRIRKKINKHHKSMDFKLRKLPHENESLSLDNKHRNLVRKSRTKSKRSRSRSRSRTR